MTVNFVEVQDNLRIDEDQYASNPNVVGFTKFTSCIGIVAILTNKNLIGIHIVTVKNAIFGEDPNDVQMVLNLLKDREKVIIVGQDAVWRDPRNGNIPQVYEELKQKLGNPPVVATNDGVFHVKKVGDDLKVMVCIESEPKPQEGQTSRSSNDFSTKQPNILQEKIKFTLPNDDISVKIAENIKDGNDPAIFEDVKNNREEDNPNKEKLYVADPQNAKEKFFVCIETP